jgi:hypothetical protein
MIERDQHKMGRGGACICVRCGRRAPHDAGRPCRDERCPECGAAMLREGSDHHRLYLEKKARAERKARSGGEGPGDESSGA